MEVQGRRGCEDRGAGLPELITGRGEEGGELAVEGLVEVSAAAEAKEGEELFVGERGERG